MFLMMMIQDLRNAMDDLEDEIDDLMHYHTAEERHNYTSKCVTATNIASNTSVTCLLL
jgi:hypothetical protein